MAGAAARWVRRCTLSVSCSAVVSGSAPVAVAIRLVAHELLPANAQASLTLSGRRRLAAPGTRQKPADLQKPLKVSDGIRTRDRRDHNPELYQLSYAHQALGQSSTGPGVRTGVVVRDRATGRA
jgi:hypothetical protein